MGGCFNKTSSGLSVVQCLGSFCLDFFCWRVFLEPNRLSILGRVDRTTPIKTTHCGRLREVPIFLTNKNGKKTKGANQQKYWNSL